MKLQKLIKWANKHKIEELMNKTSEEILELESLTLSHKLGTITPVTHIPAELGYLQNLQELKIFKLSGKSLPLEITNLKKLRRLELIGLGIEVLQAELIAMPSLEELNIMNCFKLNVLPVVNKKLYNLKKFSIQIYRGVNLPEFVGQFLQLQELYMDNIPFEEIPLSICSLKNLHVLHFRMMHLKKFPPEIANLSSLETFRYEAIYGLNIPIRELNEEVCSLESLKNFHYGAGELALLPQSIKKLLSKGYIKINGHDKVETIETLQNLELLKKGFEIVESYDECIEEENRVKIITYRFKQEPLICYMSKEKVQKHEDEYNQLIKKVAKKAMEIEECKRDSL